MKKLLAVLVVSIFCTAGSISKAATINVVGKCLLARAIVAANTNQAFLGCPRGSGLDTIVLSPGSVHRPSRVNNTVFGNNGLPAITSPIVILGNGSTIVRMPETPAFRLLAVTSEGNLTLRGVTISGGNVRGEGGGIYNDGILSIFDSAFTANLSAFSGGAIENYGTLDMTNVTVSGNRTGGTGGGMYLNYNTFTTLTNCTIVNNRAASAGGVHASGFVDLVKTLVSNNEASRTFAPDEIQSFEENNVTINNFNLFGDNGGAAIDGIGKGATDIIPQQTIAQILNPVLQTVVSPNGAVTKLHPLVAGSAAIDAVNDGTCPPPARDQRGAVRPVDGNGDGGVACDIGAYEYALP